MPRNPKVFVAVLNWNGLKDTLECLESLYGTEYDNLEIIVVDNGSTDDSVDVIRARYPDIAFISHMINRGYSGGNNSAMLYALDHGADYVWLLNNDTAVESSSLGCLVETAEKDSIVGLISPVIYYYDSPHTIQFGGSYIDWKNHMLVSRDDDLNDTRFRTGEDVCLWGTALLVKRRLIEEIGYFDEDFFAYWEDTDYSLRALKAGYRSVICTEAKIYHKTPVPRPGNTNRSPLYYYYMTRNRYFLASRHFRDLGRLTILRHYIAEAMLSIMCCKNCNDWAGAEACLQGLWDALRGIGGAWEQKRIPLWIRGIGFGFASWHPCFWARVLKGNFMEKSAECSERAEQTRMHDG